MYIKEKMLQTKEKIKSNNAVKKLNKKIGGFLAALLVAITPMVSHADISNVNVDSINEESAIVGFVNLVLRVGLYVGIALIIIGIMQLAESQMSDAPERRASGAKMLVAGVILVGLEQFVKRMGFFS